jgi:hypothetical protein
MKMENVWKTIQEPGYAAFIPSSLILLMAIEDGWHVAKIEPMPFGSQLGFVYCVTLKSRSGRKSQKLTMLKNALIEKMLTEHGPAIIPS